MKSWWRLIERQKVRLRRTLKAVWICGMKSSSPSTVRMPGLGRCYPYQQLNNGKSGLGVHIADVSYYVTEGSASDQEAIKRGTFRPGHDLCGANVAENVCQMVFVSLIQMRGIA